MNAGMKMMMLNNRKSEQSSTQNRYGSQARMGGYDKSDNSLIGGYGKAEYMPYSGGHGMERVYDPSMTYDTYMGGYAAQEQGEEMRMGHEQPHTSKMQIGFASGEEDVMPFSQMTAEKWVRSMEGEDGSKGPHWSIDQVKTLMAQKGIDCDFWEFYTTINAMYSDYGATLKKHGVGDKIELYIDLAKDFIKDKDAQPDKLSRYFKYIVKH